MTINGSAAYTEGGAFQAEKRTVFATEWLPVALGSQIPVTGDYTSNSIGGWPVFAVRGVDAIVRTFRNVCRHQNMQVVETSSGRCTELRCRYHGWTYDLAGRFVTAPAPVAPSDTASPNIHLREVATASLRDIVLFSLAATPAPPSLGAVGAFIARELGVADARYAGAVTSEIGCNWKTCIEHALSAPAGAWQWPLLLAASHPAGVVLLQVVPRTFLRTRVIAHLLVPACNTESSATLLQPEAAALKSACEALQADRAAGRMAAAEGRVAEFHDRLAAAYAADPGA